MTDYARNTAVSARKSRMELEGMLEKFGAYRIATLVDRDTSMVAFSAHDRQIRLSLPVPQLDDRKFTHTPTGKKRDAHGTQVELEKEIRRRWRSLVLLVKAKITAINDGIVEFEEEFLPHVVMADGSTVFERAKEQISIEYETGKPTQLLLGNFQ
ncbi:MAG: hypothetical protein COB78_09840 [Hyphomicrobiales bacterium]|nr:MAG: hypothetical protein COB78_09840 [Hyphomicrobiales bacterium]